MSNLEIEIPEPEPEPEPIQQMELKQIELKQIEPKQIEPKQIEPKQIEQLELELDQLEQDHMKTSTCNFQFRDYINATFSKQSSIIEVNCCFSGELDAGGLSEYPNLTTVLFLKPGKITALFNLPPTITTLKCSNQQLSNIPSTIVNIEILNLSDNYIDNKSLTVLGTFTKLVDLNLDNNRFSGAVENLPDSLTAISFIGNSISTLNISNLYHLTQLSVPDESASFHLITKTTERILSGGGNKDAPDFAGAVKILDSLKKKQEKYPTKCSKCKANDHALRFWKTEDNKQNIIWHAECPRFRAALNMGKTKSIPLVVQELNARQHSLRHRVAMHAENELFEYGSIDKIQAASEIDGQLAAEVKDAVAARGSQLRELYVFENTNLQKKAYQEVSKMTLELSNAHSRPYDTPEEYSNSIAERVEELMSARKKYTDVLNAPELSRWTVKRPVLTEDNDERTAIHSLSAFCMYASMKSQTERVVDLGTPPSILTWTNIR